MNLPAILALLCLSLISPRFSFAVVGQSTSPATSSPASSSAASSAQSPPPPALQPAVPKKPPAPSSAPSHPKRRKVAQGCSNPAGDTAKPGAKPCSTAKVVVKNGGSNEPTVQLNGAADELQQRAGVERLNAVTEENLKKIEGRQLPASQQEALSQARLFIEQSKAALASGDFDRSHNLATKASLLADELLKP